ncbi:MAG: hypothetical protein ACKVHP_23100, partial [Verrucomicrobiales bacterium]
MSPVCASPFLVAVGVSCALLASALAEFQIEITPVFRGHGLGSDGLTMSTDAGE